MKNFEREFADFLADYDIDVYDSADLGDDKFRFDCVVIEIMVSELRVRMKAQKAVKDANDLWDDCQISLESFKLNEKSADEFDFSIVVKFIDESEKAEEERQEEILNDSIKRKVVSGGGPHTEEVWGTLREVEIDPDDYEYEIVSDISGKPIETDEDLGGAWFCTKTKEICSTDEALNLYKNILHVRKIKREELPDEFTESPEYDPDEQYFTDDYYQAQDAVTGQYYTEDTLLNDVESLLLYGEEEKGTPLFIKIDVDNIDDYVDKDTDDEFAHLR